MQLCAWEGCDKPAKSSYSDSRSKYCTECAPVAYRKFREARDAEGEARRQRYEGFAKLWAEARELGDKAFEDAQPTPMVVVERANPFDDTSEVVREYPPVMDGVCGFAWLVITPGGSSFARWASKNVGAKKAYYGGVQVWAPWMSQSYERKLAGMSAMAEHLREGLEQLDPKVKVYAQGRLD